MFLSKLTCVWRGVLCINVNEWKDNIYNRATKNKEIYFFVGSWNIEVYTEIRVSSHDRKGQFWSTVDKDLYPIWNCNMTPLFEDQTNMAPLKKNKKQKKNKKTVSTYLSGLEWVTDLCCLENCVFR